MRATEQAAQAAERDRAQKQYRWPSTAEAARTAHGVCEDTIRAWIASGELEAFNVGTTKKPRYRVNPESLAALIERRKQNQKVAS